MAGSSPATTYEGAGLDIIFDSPAARSESELRNRGLQLRQALLDRFACGVDDRVGLAVERIAAGEDAPEIVHRFGVIRHRAGIALGQDPAHMLFRRGLEPHGETAGEQEVEGAGLGDEAAAGGDHRALVALDHRLKAAPLEAAERRLAVKGEDLAELKPAFALDLAVELDEGNAARGGETAAERRLAGAAQADEGDAVATPLFHRRAEGIGEDIARLGKLHRRQALESLQEEGELDRTLGPVAHDVGERQSHRLGDLAQQDDRDVAVASLELGEVALRDGAVARHDLARHPAPRPCLANALAEEAQIISLPVSAQAGAHA